MSSEPLRTTTYTLTRPDALAYEQASERTGPMGTLVLILWLAFCGALAWLIPADFAGERLGWSFSLLASVLVGMGYVLFLIGVSIRQYARARRRLRQPQEVTVAEWSDRLQVSGDGLPQDLPFADIRESILTRTHLFLVSDSAVLILPKGAFAQEDVIDELAGRIAGRPPKVDAGASAA